MNEKWEVTKWAGLGVAILIVVTLIGFGLSVVDKRVERKILVSSHQYKEGMADRAAVLNASLAEIDSRLTSSVDAGTRADLEAQRATINVQLQAIRR